MSKLVIDTSSNLFNAVPKSQDPFDHLGPVEWVDKQIEYGSKEQNISGKGLVSIIKKLTGNLIGCEIGVCHGFTTEYFLNNLINIKKIYAIDSYPTFIDWGGVRLTQERQQETKDRCAKRLSNYTNVELVYSTSSQFVNNIENNELDFIFIDGDHSYEATLEDIKNYWPKVKTGGVFAGHDIYLPSVAQALKEFFKDKFSDISVVENSAWYVIK
jgi:predicted O-methyltransferase YrrM